MSTIHCSESRARQMITTALSTMLMLIGSTLGALLLLTAISRKAKQHKVEIDLAPSEGHNLKQSANALTPHSTCKDVLWWLPPDAPSPLVLQVVSQNYLRYELNFLIAMKDTGVALSSLFLLCLDQKSVVSVFDSTNGSVRCVEVIDVHPTPDFHMIWKLRTTVLACLVGEGGRDVLLSDNDALWLKNPLEDLSAVQGDIVAQRGIMPAEFGDPINKVTMCMGFALLRGGSDGMRIFLDRWLTLMDTVGDDQIAVNQAAHSLHMEWIYEGISDMRFLESTQPGYGVLVDLPGNFTVTFLPHDKYPRKCRCSINSIVTNETTVVAHCFPKHHASREQEMRDCGVWWLD